MKRYNVFISRKSADDYYAKQIYDYLISKGLTVFESDHTLGEIGTSEYVTAIDDALQNSENLLVVGSSKENLESSWVKYEWTAFASMTRSGKKKGGITTLYASPLKLKDIPFTINIVNDCFPFNKNNFPHIYNRLRPIGTPPLVVPKRIYKQEKENVLLRWAIGGLLLLLVAVFAFFYIQPYDATIILQQSESIQLNKEYPPFNGGKLSLFINNEVKESQILDNGEVIFKQLSYTTKGEKMAVKLANPYWKTEQDSIEMGKTIHLGIIPNGSLGVFRGQVRVDGTSTAIPNATIQIGTDTTIITDAQGAFNFILPTKMQKEQYRLRISKSGFETKDTYTDSTNYYPNSNEAIYTLRRIR